jgi:hypothetical protein
MTEHILARIALVLVVGAIVGGATYVVLTIMEILKKKANEGIDAPSEKDE